MMAQQWMWVALFAVVAVLAAMLVGVLAVGCVHGFVTRCRGSDPEGRAVRVARRANAQSVRRAEKSLRAAERSYRRSVRSAERALASAEAQGSQRLVYFRGRKGSVSLTPTTIEVDEGAFPVTTELTATVDTAGGLATTSRSTLSRMAAGDLLLGPLGVVAGAAARKSRVVDTRELYMLIEGKGFASLIVCDPNGGVRAREVAAEIIQAGQRSTGFAEEWSRAARSAERALEHARRSTGPVEIAARALESAKAEALQITPPETARAE